MTRGNDEFDPAPKEEESKPEPKPRATDAKEPTGAALHALVIGTLNATHAAISFSSTSRASHHLDGRLVRMTPNDVNEAKLRLVWVAELCGRLAVARAASR